jgi:hypothetical protein
MRAPARVRAAARSRAARAGRLIWGDRGAPAAQKATTRKSKLPLPSQPLHATRHALAPTPPWSWGAPGPRARSSGSDFAPRTVHWQRCGAGAARRRAGPHTSCSCPSRRPAAAMMAGLEDGGGDPEEGPGVLGPRPRPRGRGAAAAAAAGEGARRSCDAAPGPPQQREPQHAGGAAAHHRARKEEPGDAAAAPTCIDAVDDGARRGAGPRAGSRASVGWTVRPETPALPTLLTRPRPPRRPARSAAPHPVAAAGRDRRPGARRRRVPPLVSARRVPRPG